MKIVVLDGYTLNPGDLSWEGLEKLGEVKVYDRTEPKDLLKRAKGASVLFTNKTALNRESLTQLEGLSYIGVLATGTNVVDLKAAKELGIEVTNIPAYSTGSVAQLTFALLLELCHSTYQHIQSVKKGKWSKCKDFCYKDSHLVELSGKTMGIVGFGQIGQQVALIAQAFGMEVFYSNRSQKKGYNLIRSAKQVELDELLKKSDVVSLNCPLTDDTKGLIGKNELSLMKREAFLINTGRGPLVDEQAIADAVASGTIAGYAADVLSQEPPQADHPFFKIKNIFITPHIAWQTKEARQRLMAQAIENLRSYIGGETINSVL